VQKNIELRQKDHGVETEFSILLLDIDHFKTVNDTYGHLVGDFVIKNISELFTKSTRLIDTCYRIGGDEFAILLVNTDLKSTLKVGEKLRKLVEETEFVINDLSLKITLSIGCASSHEAETMKELVTLADGRLYYSKEHGRNQIN